MLKFLMQRFLGDALRQAIMRGLRKCRAEKLNLEDPAHFDQITYIIMDEIASESEKGIQGARKMVDEFNKLPPKRRTRFKPLNKG